MWKALLSVAIFGAVLGVVPILAQGSCEGLGGEPLYTCLGRQIADLQKQLEMSRAATTPLESELKKLESQIKSIQAQIRNLEKKQAEVEAGIMQREETLEEQYVLLAIKMREHYKRVRSNSILVWILSSVESGERSRELGYREEAAAQNRTLILSLSNEIVSLQKDKEDLAANKKRLAGLQASLDKQADFFETEIKKARDYQSSLSGKIASLSALQESILSGKGETFQTTVGDVPLADDPNSRPDYNPGFSPAFAAFSFGAPHFKGMSQYGALGRAKQGQNYEQILKAYYGGGVEIRDHDPNAQIRVDNYGTYSLEEYAKRIYEMPGSWGDEGGMEALKAQAVAARSYALARGGSICATEACQVFKPSPKGGKWEEAVNATRGKVVYANGAPYSTWYASTSGGYQEAYSSNGYSTPGFWDAVGGRSGWTSQAYEKIAGSPWFYKGWYKDRGGVACGRSHPWLNSEEMADILNAWVVLYQGGGDASRVVPVDLTSCWGKSGSPYSMAELRGIGGFTAVSGVVSVVYSSNGFTERVVFSTNKGEMSVSGGELKKAFNLRAPGRIALKSGLFNFEKK